MGFVEDAQLVVTQQETPECVDLTENCAQRASDGDCQSADDAVSTFMLVNCARACDSCLPRGMNFVISINVEKDLFIFILFFY